MIAIIGVLASIATVAYSDYVRTTQAQAVSANYELAVDRVEQNYAAARTYTVNGRPVTSLIPDNSQAWADMLNGGNGSAPGGGEAYLTGAANDVTGAVGVIFNGDYDTRTSTVTLLRPAYAGLPAQARVVSQLDF